MDWVLDIEHGPVNFFRIAVIITTAIAVYASIHVDHPPRHNTMAVTFIGGTFTIGAVFGLAYATGVINSAAYFNWLPVISMMMLTAQTVFGVLFVRFANEQRRIAERERLARRQAARDRMTDAELFRLDHEGERRRASD